MPSLTNVGEPGTVGAGKTKEGDNRTSTSFEVTAMRTGAIVAANVLLTLEHLVVASLALGALSALPVWTLTSAAARGPWLDALLAFHLRILATFLAGVLIVLALRAPRREWFARAKLRDGPRVLLTLSMIVLASWAITSAATWLVRWREGVRLLDEGGVWNALRNGADVVSGSIAMGVLLLPGLLAATAASFLLVSAVTLLLLWAESGTLLRALTQGVLLGGAFLWGSFHALDLFDRVSELTAPLSEAGDAEGAQVQAWFRQNREQSAAAVESLRWQFVAYVGFGVAVVVMARSRISGDESEPEPRVAEWSDAGATRRSSRTTFVLRRPSRLVPTHPCGRVPPPAGSTPPHSAMLPISSGRIIRGLACCPGDVRMRFRVPRMTPRSGRFFGPLRTMARPGWWRSRASVCSPCAQRVACRRRLGRWSTPKGGSSAPSNGAVPWGATGAC